MIGSLQDRVMTHHSPHLSEVNVTNVNRTKSILLCKEKLFLYIHEGLELHGSLWKLTIANASGGGE